MEKIRIENLSFKYPLAERFAISDINLLIQASEFIVLCGKSGCGKSTLLRHMKKQLAPYGYKTGKVFIDREEIQELDERMSVIKTGFLQQNPDSQIVTDKVWHELAFGLENLGMSNNVIKRRVAEMANYFGIQTWFDKDISKLSGGQKQLLNLASIMVMQPEILILDEPTSQLDPIATSEFLNTVYKINKELGVTIIISEHRLEELIPIADKIAVMDKGSIIAFDTPENIPKKLVNENTQEKHPMFYGLPAVMRIFQVASKAIKKAPLTVRDGRLLLEKLIDDEKDLSDSSVKKKRETKELNTNKKVEEAVAAIKNIWFKYDKTSGFVVRGADLQLKKGEIFSLMGGNGSGKSTLLKLMCGVIKPQRGKIKTKENLRISMVPQNPQALFTEITAEEELYEGMAFMNISETDKFKRVDDMLKLMEIKHLRKTNPYDMSGGEQQRLAIGKILLTEPELLLLDEPTKGLDPFFKKTLSEILKNLTSNGLTILMVSHDIEFCAEYADRCAMFFNGEIISADEARNFFAGNSFYTTAANKLFRNYKNDIIRCEEAERWLKERI